MTKNHPQRQQRGSISNRSAMFAWMNSLFAFFIAVSFISVYVFSIYQLDWWKDYFFAGTYALKDSCRMAAIGSDKLDAWEVLQQAPLTRVVVPHPRDLVRKMVPAESKYYHMHYQCDIDTQSLPTSDGVVYLHTGWIAADETSVVINQVPRTNFKGTDKAVIPLTNSDLSSQNFRIDIYATSKLQSQLGLSGNQPMVLGIGADTNARVLGIEVSLRYIRGIVHILPMLTLGIVLVFAWIFGIRIRLMLPAFWIFSMLMGRFGLLIFFDFIPLKFETIQRLQDPFGFGANIGFVLFGMELLGIYPKKIYPAMRFCFSVVVCYSIWIICDKQFIVTDFMTKNVVPAITTVSSLIFAVLGTRNWLRSPGKGHWKKIRAAYVVVSIFFAIALLTEVWFRQVGIPVHPSKYLSMIMPLYIGGTMLFTLALIEVQYRVEAAKRISLQNAFVKYVPIEVAEMVQGEVTPDLGGQRKKITCMFLDIQGFTPICNRLQPEETIKLLNIFFTGVQDVIAKHDGYIESFLGDGAMVTWGSVKDSACEASAAVSAAQDLLDQMSTINQKLNSSGLPSLVIRMGIHYGEAIVGNIGSEARMEFTSIGPVVNVASRLEGLCKEHKTSLIVSRQVHDQIAPELKNQNWTIVKGVAIRGVNTPVSIAIWREQMVESFYDEVEYFPSTAA